MTVCSNGMKLDTYKAELKQVSFRHNAAPWTSFDGAKVAGPEAMAELFDIYERKSFIEMARYISLETYQQYFSFEQLCKVRMSSIIMMSNDVEDYFRDDPEAVLMNKIQNSIWRWGYRRALWNDVVVARDSMLRFDLGLADFTVTLDHTTGHNEKGHSEYSRTFLDGVFAYLIHYRGEHVMTVGFSIVGGRRVLIQQIQLVKRRGNRFLFKFPKNRVEFIIDRFRAAFSAHRFFIADGEELAQSSLRDYKAGRERCLDAISRMPRAIESTMDKLHDELVTHARSMRKEELAVYEKKITHLTSDLPRLKAFYADVGRHTLGKPMRVGNMTHYSVVVSN